ncbi:hypothetical protein WJE63_004447 [Klebsiella pneumoniae]
MPLSTNTIQEYTNLVSKLGNSGWDIIGAYWVNYAHGQKNLCITATGLDQRNLNVYRQSLYNTIEDLRPKNFSIYDVRICGDDEFHSGIFHLEEYEECKLLKNIFFKGTFLKELYIFRCLESESTKKYPPRKKITLFKYFKNPQFKEDFLNGKVWVGTLSDYRRIENANQGDRVEGVTHYNTTQRFTKHNWGQFTNKNPMLADTFMKFKFTEGNSLTISNLTVRLPDAYTVCFSKLRDDELFKDDFGEYCVKINDAEKLFSSMLISITSLHSDLKYTQHQSIEYNKKPLDDYAESVYSVFHKPERYAWQEEYRFAWSKGKIGDLSPFLLDAGQFISPGLIEDLI